jgi:hypothetical protein
MKLRPLRDVILEGLGEAWKYYPKNLALKKCFQIIGEIESSKKTGFDDLCQAIQSLPDGSIKISRCLDYYKTVTFDLNAVESGEIDLYRAMVEDDTWHSVFDLHMIKNHASIIPAPSVSRKLINFGYCLHCCLKATTTKYASMLCRVIEALSNENWKMFTYHCQHGYNNGIPASRSILSWLRYEYQVGQYGPDYDLLADVIAIMDRNTSLAIDKWFDQCLIETRESDHNASDK